MAFETVLAERDYALVQIQPRRPLLDRVRRALSGWFQ